MSYFEGAESVVVPKIPPIRRKRESDGLCRMCGECPPKEDRKQCEDCLEKARQKYYSKSLKAVPKEYNPLVCNRKGCAKEDDGYRWCLSCRVAAKKNYKKWRSSGKCGHCGESVEGKALCSTCSDTLKLNKRNRNKELKERVYDAYGRQCRCCGESEMLFLELDHVNNDGKELRKIHGAGVDLYAYLIETNFPDFIQVLCVNCNRGKARNGGVCPHKTRTFGDMLAELGILTEDSDCGEHTIPLLP